jgi:hypothetical protein
MIQKNFMSGRGLTESLSDLLQTSPLLANETTSAAIDEMVKWAPFTLHCTASDA